MNRNRFALALLATLVPMFTLVPGAPLRAATWYVAPGGDDASDCGTAATPCLTINGAVAKAADGDAILVSEGTYTATSGAEVVSLGKSVTLSGGWDAAFDAQGGRSVIDGGGARRGITAGAGVIAAVDHFTIANGFSDNSGGGIYQSGGGGTLSLSACAITNNASNGQGGGITNLGTLYLDATTVTGNSCGRLGYSGGGGGGGIETWGTAVVNNSTVSGNVIRGSFSGSGIDVLGGALVLNNSTVSGNSGGDGIHTFVGTITLSNATITLNQTHGVTNVGGNVTLQNTVLAGNGSSDCVNTDGYSGTVTSGGYNLIGNGDGCALAPAAGDQVGSAAAPIDPLLLPLQANGGPTSTHALRYGSPALDAGNPAAPGSADGACLATDQRGVARPVGSLCDIGAFEGYATTVLSILRADPNPAGAASVGFTVTFASPVTGVDAAAPFGDFALTTTGATTAEVSAVSGSGDTYAVTVSLDAHSGNGTVRLDVVDDDTIVDDMGGPLGGQGAGNGDFTAGESYTVLTIPPPLSPAGKITTARPRFRWTRVPGATRYRYQLLKGSRVLFARIVASGACGENVCSDTPTTRLPTGPYKWRVQSMLGGAWKSYSAYTPFTVTAKAGFWSGYGLEFYVTPDLASVDNFAIYIGVTGCGYYKITHLPLVRIANGRFLFTGPFYASGRFSSPNRVSGQLGLRDFYIPGCGYLTGGPFPWTGAWKSAAQPGLVEGGDARPAALTPLGDAPAASFSVEPAEAVTSP